MISIALHLEEWAIIQKALRVIQGEDTFTIASDEYFSAAEAEQKIWSTVNLAIGKPA